MTSAAAPSAALLTGDVLHIGFHGTGKMPYPEDIVVPAVLRAVAQHLGAELHTEGMFWGDYCFFAGVTGAAFRFLELMGLNTDTTHTPLVERYGQRTVPRMYARALAAAGLAGEVLTRPHLPAQAELQRRIVESVGGRQCPVIGLGVFGPPEPFLITGYAADGAVLCGWSHLQQDMKEAPNVTFEPTGQFRLSDWYDTIDGIVLVTGTGERPALRSVYREALELGIRELAVTGTAGAPLGTAALERWAAYLEDETLGTGWSAERWDEAQKAHGSTGGELAERRALADTFLQLACRFLPEAADDLAGAATAFGSSHDTVYEIWETVARSGPFDPDLAKFQDLGHRRSMASLVRRLVELDRRGQAFMERALCRIDGKEPGPSPGADPVLDGTAILVKAPQPAPAEVRWAPENIALPNTMGMLAAFLGQTVSGHNDYSLWMGLTGAAFGLLWDGAQRGNLELAFDALGYDYELWMSHELAAETGIPCRRWGWDDNLRRRIFWNLRDRQLPVLLFGCGPWPDWWLVTRAVRRCHFEGYGGSSGEGYRPNEPLDHAKNPLRPIDLFAGMKGQSERTWTVNLLARRATPPPALRELYPRAIAWGAACLRRPRMRLFDAAGTTFVSETPYVDWAATLETDALFPADRPDVLQQRRQDLEGHEVELAERRFYGAAFLEAAAAALGHPPWRQAAAHMRRVHELLQASWTLLGGLHGPEAHLRLGDAATRQQLAARLREVAGEDAAVADLLEA